MADERVWFITGAGRGMGVDIAQAALAAGYAVAATGRNTEAVTDAVGEADDLLVVELDITSLASAEAAVQAAVDRFGRIDVLVNNAGNFYAGYFEELTPEQIERSLTTNLVGPMNVTRAVLPMMRKQRSGNVVTITSTAGIVGQEFCSAYAAAKFGVEGWMESLRFEVEPFGIQTTIVEPGFFRTELLEKESTAYADLSIDDYAERTAQTRPAWETMSGKQGGDPAKLAKALVTVVDQEQPPLCWVAGADAVEAVEQKANDLLAQVDAYRSLSSSLALDEAQAGRETLVDRHTRSCDIHERGPRQRALRTPQGQWFIVVTSRWSSRPQGKLMLMESGEQVGAEAATGEESKTRGDARVNAAASYPIVLRSYEPAADLEERLRRIFAMLSLPPVQE